MKLIALEGKSWGLKFIRVKVLNLSSSWSKKASFSMSEQKSKDRM